MDQVALVFAGVGGQAELLRNRQVSARDLTELCLRRIDALDRRVRAFTCVLAEAALRDADRAQACLDAGESGPLLGVPVAVKDEVDVVGSVTSYGTGAQDRPAQADCDTVRRLRLAGAVIVGKTALPELGLWGHMTDTVTWGTTRNPWDVERSPGGSSGGSAAAVAAGMVPVALGSDGGASIRVPAAMCGLFGLKPQRGRVSLMPAHEQWYGMVSRGGLARSVADSATFLDAIAGPAPGDASTPPAPARPFAEAARMEPRRLRIAVSTKPVLHPVRLDPQIGAAVERTAELLRSLGHEVQERDPWYPLALDLGVPRYAAGVRDDAARLAHRDRLERRTRHIARLGQALHGRPLARALRLERPVTDRVNAIFSDHDLLLTPTIAQLPPRADRWHDKGALATFAAMTPYITYTAIWNYTGQPAASVPAGFTPDGMPLAVQIVARPNDEPTLISLAAQLERARPWAHRRPPVADRV
jgi:amidase